ncbi:MAG TPA: hypothetical protein VGC60_15895 [Pyrinomonadaceae bacterium]|jgi:hypothetical protein
MNSEKPLIFISCGQVTPAEKALGRRIKELIDKSGVFQGYFAENQSTLEGVTQHIFSQLDNCFGLICVMHERGEVSSAYGKTVRASVWIEQELAIAAFLTAVQQRRIKIQVYSKNGIHREGVRDKVLINPKEFETDADILAHIPEMIRGWSHDIADQDARMFSRDLVNLLDELRDNAEVLSKDLSNFQPVSEEVFREVKKSGSLAGIEPSTKSSIKQAYGDITNYASELQRINNIQNYSFRANEIHMFLNPAKTQAQKTVRQAVADVEKLLSKA